MSLYNILFCENDQAKFLFRILELENCDLGRYRDIYVTEWHVVVHTRNGGGNREEYQYVFDLLAEHHPLYDYDEDDDFDCTYADIYFRHPEKYKELLREMAQGTITPAEKWRRLLGMNG